MAGRRRRRSTTIKLLLGGFFFTTMISSFFTERLPVAWWAGGIVVALLVDVYIGEPPVQVHPVVWMGKYLAVGKRIAPTKTQANNVVGTKAGLRFITGALAWLLGAVMVVTLAAVIQYYLLKLPMPLGLPLVALVFKPMMAWQMLADCVWKTEMALSESLDAGRERLLWLVSRDVSSLQEVEIRESAIESLSENFNDSVLGPVLAFALGGLPGATLYRYANTADAMWGYPGWHGTPEPRDWSWAGKWAARTDDVLSWPGARLTALAFLLGCPTGLWRRLPTEASLTPSPNSGWPMAAMAMALGIRLGKPGGYTLNRDGRKPTAQDTKRAIDLARRVVLFMGALAGLILAWSLLMKQRTTKATG